MLSKEEVDRLINDEQFIHEMESYKMIYVNMSEEQKENYGKTMEYEMQQVLHKYVGQIFSDEIELRMKIEIFLLIKEFKKRGLF